MIEHDGQEHLFHMVRSGTLEGATVTTVGSRLLQQLPLSFVKDNYAVALPYSGEKRKWGLACLPDVELAQCEAGMYILGGYNYGIQDFTRQFDILSRRALKATVWIEVGFGGFDAFADNPASASWIARLGQYHTPEDRDELMRTKGKQFYEETMALYKRFREKENVYGVKDAFQKHGLESLLEPFGIQTDSR